MGSRFRQHTRSAVIVSFSLQLTPLVCKSFLNVDRQVFFWHVISRSGVVISITNCYIRFTFFYFTSLVDLFFFCRQLASTQLHGRLGVLVPSVWHSPEKYWVIWLKRSLHSKIAEMNEWHLLIRVLHRQCYRWITRRAAPVKTSYVCLHLRWTRLVPGWVTVFGFNSWCVTSHPGQLSLAIPSLLWRHVYITCCISSWNKTSARYFFINTFSSTSKLLTPNMYWWSCKHLSPHTGRISEWMASKSLWLTGNE